MEKQQSTNDQQYQLRPDIKDRVTAAQVRLEELRRQLKEERKAPNNVLRLLTFFSFLVSNLIEGGSEAKEPEKIFDPQAIERKSTGISAFLTRDVETQMTAGLNEDSLKHIMQQVFGGQKPISIESDGHFSKLQDLVGRPGELTGAESLIERDCFTDEFLENSIKMGMCRSTIERFYRNLSLVEAQIREENPKIGENYPKVEKILFSKIKLDKNGKLVLQIVLSIKLANNVQVNRFDIKLTGDSQADQEKIVKKLVNSYYDMTVKAAQEVVQGSNIPTASDIPGEPLRIENKPPKEAEPEKENPNDCYVGVAGAVYPDQVLQLVSYFNLLKIHTGENSESSLGLNLNLGIRGLPETAVAGNVFIRFGTGIELKFGEEESFLRKLAFNGGVDGRIYLDQVEGGVDVSAGVRYKVVGMWYVGGKVLLVMDVLNDDLNVGGGAELETGITF